MQGKGLTNGLVFSLRLITVLGVALLVMALFVLDSPATTEESASVSAKPSTAPLQTAPVPPRLEARVARAMRTHGCSAQHRKTDIDEWSALVIIRGSVRHVDFDRGWAVYTGQRPGRFLALCRST